MEDKMNFGEAIDLAIIELGWIGGYSWNDVRDMLHDGRISRDMFDLYDDVWNCRAARFSVPEYQIEESKRQLIARYE
jgi:hypothetical protein